ncbi:MAG: hypothetical protein CR971_01765 [candidate division SR1 bacterium]|nr:MAG: hypothetical protein CR971_01765 [candidate division SR1 bacterium]
MSIGIPTGEVEKIIKPLGGESIYDFAHQLIAAANKESEGRKIIGVFNGVKIIVDPTEEIYSDNIVNFYLKEAKKGREEYKNSPEGIQKEKEYRKNLEFMQKKTNKLIEDLNNLNFSDYELILEWLCDFENASNNTNIFCDREKVISVFKEHGFDIDANLGENIDEENAENIAKFIAGQILNGISKCGKIRPISSILVKNRKQKFGKHNQKIEELKKNL